MGKDNKKKTILDFQLMKDKNEKITFLTSYDATFVKILDEAGIDGILVGDSLGMVIQGKQNTLEVTVEDIIYHTSIVSRGITKAHLVADMPFMSYQVSKEEALKNAGRLIKEGRAESVKLEGGAFVADTVHHIQKAGIPAIGVGAGVHCDGQVLVIYDLLGMDNSFFPKFAKRYANLHEIINSAVRNYIEDVRSEKFPSEENSFN